ncbi:class I SAM-dependent methyltransferase [Alkalihalobacillus trypoxylicola]|nr:class I SAM-dependent methyltransferase [Alkalihalobacillus trypoxylicola]
MEGMKKMTADNRIINGVQHQFGKNAQKYVESSLHSKGKDLTKLIEGVNHSGIECVLDIATGGGHVANSLAPIFNKVYALDVTEPILKAAEQFITKNGHQNVEFVLGNAEELPFPNEYFDTVTCRIAAHHFANIAAFVQEAHRVLKTNGQLLIIDNVAPENDFSDYFYNEMEKLRDYSHQRALKKSEWIRMIESTSFELLEMNTFRKIFYFDDWCERMDVSDSLKKVIEKKMLNANDEIKNHFQIKINAQNKINSFQGQSAFIHVVKS